MSKVLTLLLIKKQKVWGMSPQSKRSPQCLCVCSPIHTYGDIHDHMNTHQQSGSGQFMGTFSCSSIKCSAVIDDQ